MDLGGIDASWFVARQAITLGKQLGSGAFGAVKQCTVEGWSSSSSEVVAKRVLPQKLNRKDVCPRSRSKSTPDTHATPVTSKIFLHSAVNKTHVSFTLPIRELK